LEESAASVFRIPGSVQTQAVLWYGTEHKPLQNLQILEHGNYLAINTKVA
jgi:hypothetical protein